jgi:hypothetical protein
VNSSVWGWKAALIFRASPSWFVEVAVPFTVVGRNWPAGPVLTLKLTKAF